MKHFTLSGIEAAYVVAALVESLDGARLPYTERDRTIMAATIERLAAGLDLAPDVLARIDGTLRGAQ